MKKVTIAYNNGNFYTIAGRNLQIRTLTPTMFGISEDDKIIYLGNVTDIRYVREKLETKTVAKPIGEGRDSLSYPLENVQLTIDNKKSEQ